MYRTLFWFTLFLTCVCSCFGQDTKKLDAVLASLAEEAGGCSLLIFNKDGVLYEGYAGDFRADTVIDIASSSKWLSGAVVMALVDEGAIALDDPVSKYLDAFKGEAEDITVAQLMSHTSGMASTERHAAFRQKTLQRAAQRIAKEELIGEPGTVFAYGGLSMMVAGRLCEVATGKSWETLFAEKIAKPLAMQATDYNGLKLFKRLKRAPRISGGVRSQLQDYGNFLEMILNDGVFQGKQVLSASAIKLMHRDCVGGAEVVSSPFARYSDLMPISPGYGIGCWLERFEPETGQAIVASSQGAFGCSPWVNFEDGVAGVLWVKNKLPQVMPYYWNIRKIVSSW